MYIAFEGIDNTGKSTQLELVKERLKLILRGRGVEIPVLNIAEKEIDKENLVNTNDTLELALRYALQRRLLLRNYSEELHYDSPSILLSDRSYYSSLAYQGEWAGKINEFVPRPTMIFFFDNGEPSDDELKIVYNNYFNVLPLSTIFVNTEKHSISSTTNYIAREILGKWNKMFVYDDNEWELREYVNLK